MLTTRQRQKLKLNQLCRQRFRQAFSTRRTEVKERPIQEGSIIWCHGTEEFEKLVA
jgi:hypothetical protein